MHLWNALLGSLTELDLLTLGEAFALGDPPRSAVSVLQHLLRAEQRPSLGDLIPRLSDATCRKACVAAELAVAPDADEARASLLAAARSAEDAQVIEVEAPRRKPRLAWQGMHTRPAVTAVPTQVMEVVTPRWVENKDDSPTQPSLANIKGLIQHDARLQSQAATNRLIWTHDNLVALRTLLDEKDPATGDWRYRGKVDLVYIDPPFMVSNDFIADNTVRIDVDGDEGVTATKEPSVVELLAYKDTWREGLDSFLSMLRARLVLLKDLLAPTGSIYVHLDWHAAHYVRVLMDEVFGYECFRNDIALRRGPGRSHSFYFGRNRDHILFYGNSQSHYWETQYGEPSGSYIRSFKKTDERGRYVTQPLHSGNPIDVVWSWKGVMPPAGRGWAYTREELDRFDSEGRIEWSANGNPRLKRYLHEVPGAAVQEIWTDIDPLLAKTADHLGYPTQKPVALVERIISASCPPGGLVLDCFMGSGTTAEAAERLGRRWIGIDNGKYAVHLARKRLIQLHGSPRPPEQEQADYVECEACKNIERKSRRQASPGPFAVKPFSVESMGVYQRAEVWLDALGQDAAWRPEMVRVFGGEPTHGHPMLHGRKGSDGSWIHVGPLDAPVSGPVIWHVARAVAETDSKQVTVLSADLDTLPAPERDAIRDQLGVSVVVRIIPRQAIEQVALRLKLGAGADGATESMAVPAFYTPLAIHLRAQVDGPRVSLTLAQCEVDVQSFLDSQRPALRSLEGKLTAKQRAKAEREHARWAARKGELEDWLAKADSWVQFVDFWAVDWNYGEHRGPDGKPVFDTDWQSFRVRRSKKQIDPLLLVAETRYPRPGRYQVAARVTDVFGNDGIQVVDVEVGR
ncbi:MAG: site-specific DNA-methyltransferase [Myxococcales bacterium]|nr:site-specific DNA-methyltransferase [Myxococcales bacterium]